MADAAKSLVERLFTEQRSALLAYFGRRVRSPAEMADLAQETFVRMLRVPHPELIRDPEAYLFTIAANLERERAAAVKRRGMELDAADESLEGVLSEPSTAEEAVDLDRWRRRLGEVIAELSPKCRMALVLQYRDGLTYAQIGERLGVSSNMVKKYLVQAVLHGRRRMARMG